MTKTYGADKKDLREAALDHNTFCSIGRIIRACADIEDILNITICQIAGITEGALTQLLGTATFKRRKDIGEHFATVLGPESLKQFKLLFNAELNELTECRNALAHGILLGETPEKQLSFLITKSEKPVDGKTFQNVVCYTREGLEQMASYGERTVYNLEIALKLRSLRKKRLQRPLLPHRNSRRPSGTFGKQKPPPQA